MSTINFIENKEQIIEIFDRKDVQYSPTQHRVCIPILNRILIKMLAGLKFEKIKICDDLIIDGHHRYVCSILTDSEIEEKECCTTSATQKREWIEIEFVEEEWDTEHKIQILNEKDANFNEMSIDEMIDLVDKFT